LQSYGLSPAKNNRQAVDEFTALRTNDVPTVHELFLNLGYMHGIWIFVNHSGTRILVRYEAWFRPDGQIECHMEPLGARA
jgi:hypothetical protein